MSVAKKSALSQNQNRYRLVLTATFLFVASTISHAADSTEPNSTESNNAPTTDSQKVPAQKAINEGNKSDTLSEEKVSEEKNQGKVSRAIFTSQIIDREPADNLTEISNTSDRIYFFTDLRNLEGQIITHRWEYNDRIMAEVKFKVGGGPRWRVYSSKNLLPEWVGIWTVIVTDENEQTLDASVFNYTQAAKAVENNTATGTAEE